MTFFVLGLVSFISWFVSFLAGAGSPLVLIPLVGVLCGTTAVAPVITLGMLLGNGQRSLFLWRQIDWSMTCWYVPGAIAGAVLGAYCFSLSHLNWLQWVIAIALIAMAWEQWQKNSNQSSLESAEVLPPPNRQLPAWCFLPLAFFNGMGSALIGSTGPILNPAYLGYGLLKEKMIATKAFHNALLHGIKIAAYLYFGTIQTEHWLYGLVIGAAALPGNVLGQKVLARMSPQQFKKAVLAFVAFSGVLMLFQQTVLAL